MFEKVAKELVAKEVAALHGLEVSPDDMEIVWFAHELGNKKCTIFSREMPFYPEVTFDARSNDCYVDIYKKVFHSKVHIGE
jgi:hypothetical protein